MSRVGLKLFCAVICLGCAVGLNTLSNGNDEASSKKVSRSISIVGDDFMLDGQRLHIVSGSLHYFRVPAAYWRDRLRKLKAAGLNSVSTYVEWSFHEPVQQQYDFSGDRDLGHFVRLAAEEGLHVLLRPGPYICAERDLGGFPFWLLSKYPKIRLRTQDKDYTREVNTWLAKLFEQVSPLLYGNGGPIILVQIENEYGSYGSDHDYMDQLRDVIRSHVGSNALLYTTDGTSRNSFTAGSAHDTLTTIDFGPGIDIKKAFQTLREFMPHGPLMNSEYYPGWLTHWGESLQQVNKEIVVKTLKEMMDNNININFYMFFGGTNFEFTAGANFGGVYQSDITSYDYDAPLTEAGDPTPKYYAIRSALEKYFPEVKDIPLPLSSSKGAYGRVTVSPQLQLLSSEGRSTLGKVHEPFQGASLPTFEALHQKAGYVLYEAHLGGQGVQKNVMLHISKPRDLIYVYVDGVLQGTISRMYKRYSLPIVASDNSTLSLLVQNQGRINYGPKLHDFKGILSPVMIDDKQLNGEWRITGYPIETVKVNSSTGLQVKDGAKKGPVLYDGYFTIPDKEPKDTFLDTTGWGKGYVWVNDHNLGSFWPGVGPQVTLYVPGVWLKPSPENNRLQIIEQEQLSVPLHMEFIDHPILDKTEKH